jgi:hypothetical protein
VIEVFGGAEVFVASVVYEDFLTGMAGTVRVCCGDLAGFAGHYGDLTASRRRSSGQSQSSCGEPVLDFACSMWMCDLRCWARIEERL